MKYSIITINYNNREGLQKTINSVIGQTFKDYEFIIIDGGSTDGSIEILEQHDASITFWSSEPDKGVYHAMNKGIAKAHGEYLNFMNSGDCFYSNNVLEHVNRYHSDADFIVSGNEYIGRKHLTIVAEDNNLFAIDNYSTNGSFINGNKLIPGKKYLLKDKDIIKLYDEGFTLIL